MGLSLPRVVRSIPAWAGEPSSGCVMLSLSTVYPRVGGGTSSAFIVTIQEEGLSPRGRGNPEPRRRCTHRWGSIPAWAGEPHVAQEKSAIPTVYPRVGGGTNPALAKWIGNLGLSPRGRGNPPLTIVALGASGLSPRGRGNQLQVE